MACNRWLVPLDAESESLGDQDAEMQVDDGDGAAGPVGGSQGLPVLLKQVSHVARLASAALL